MDDEFIKDDQEQQTDYDTRDAEAPIVLHHVAAGLNKTHAHRPRSHSEHYIATTLNWLRMGLRYLWSSILWNKSTWTFAATVTMAVATVLYTYYARKQWRVANETLTEIRNSKADTNRIITASETQATASKKSSDAADRFSTSADKINQETAKAVLELRRAADDAEKASAQSSQNAQRVLDATIEATRLEQRPWLAAHDGGINNFKLNEPFRATVVIWNTGKTPALYVKAVTQLMEANVDLDGPMDYSYPGPGTNWHDIGALPPQSPLTFTETDEPDHHVGNSYNEIAGGTKFLFIWGQLIYLDSSGKPIDITNLERHVTRFCWEYDRLIKQFTLCRDSSANAMN